MLRMIARTTFVLLILSVLLIASLFIPVSVENRTELANQRLGYPLHFAVQDNSRLSIGEPDSAPFPQLLSLMNPLNSPVRVLLIPLLINYLILFGFLYVLRRSLSHLDS